MRTIKNLEHVIHQYQNTQLSDHYQANYLQSSQHQDQHDINPHERLSYDLLGLRQDKFLELDGAQQSEILNKAYYRTEFELMFVAGQDEITRKIKGDTETNPNETTTQLFAKLDEAYDQIKQRCHKPDHDKSAADDYGLHGIDEQKVFVANPFTKLQDQQLPAGFYSEKNKDKGVEPGYIAVNEDEALASIRCAYPRQADRINYFAQFCNGHDSNLLQPTDAFERILGSLSSDSHSPDKPAPHLVKLTYGEPDQNQQVFPPKDNLANSSAYQNMTSFPVLGYFQSQILTGYQRLKSGHYNDVNKSALTEVLSNDLARVMGMEVQNQRLLVDQYDHKRLKLLLDAQFVDHFVELGQSPEQPKASGDHLKDGYKIRYYGHQPISDDSLSEPGFYLPLLMVQGDYDAIGSKGQNKLLKRDTNKLVGIDFGHTYPEHNSLVNNLGKNPQFYPPVNHYNN